MNTNLPSQIVQSHDEKIDNMRVILNLVQNMSEHPDPEILSIFTECEADDHTDAPPSFDIANKFLGEIASYILVGGNDAIHTVQTILGNREFAHTVYEDETASELLRCLAYSRIKVTDA